MANREYEYMNAKEREKELNKIKWKTDFDKPVIIDNFIVRKWTEVDEDEEDWNIYWATVGTVRGFFKAGSGVRLNDYQLINHFPNHYELTRKDLMVKNIKRYRKELEKEFNPLGTRDKDGTYIYLDFIPQTYILPADYSLFVEDFHKNPNNTWIVKPAMRSQGKGIFLLSKIKQLQKITSSPLGKSFHNVAMKEPHIISRYVNNPFLVGGKKFDLRIYVLVTSYRPLKVWLYQEGFARFCNENFTTDITELANVFVHLTNVAIQKLSDKYNDQHGGKWSLQSLRFYIETTRGRKAAQQLFDEMNNIIIHSLKSVQNVIMNDKHCFEMYGFDVLIDNNCKPWLIEINASPSLSTTNKSDKILKTCLINDVFTIVTPAEWTDNEINRDSIAAENIKKVGNFNLLYDESQDQKKLQKKGFQSKVWK